MGALIITKVQKLQYCSSCGEVLDAHNAYTRGDGYTRFRNRCVKCTKKFENSAKIKEYQRAYSKSNKERIKWRNIFDKYKLTKSAYEELLAKQVNSCAICYKEKELNIDHCHSTGRVRGLLCDGCNTGLGKFGDNENGLYKAILYLRGQL